MKFKSLTVIFFLVGYFASAQSKQSLNGQWNFALDPLKIGEEHKWNNPDFPVHRWDRVNVPHSFSVDSRYSFYTGQVWYFRNFQRPASATGQRVYLRFEAVFYKCTGWLNGKKIGEHEGGYTPFEWDVTEAIADNNLLALQVSNEWDQTTLPGAKTLLGNESENSGQLSPWINYGGITRDGYLIVRPQLFIQNVKIDADPDLVKKTASLKIAVNISNHSSQSANPAISASVFRGADKVAVKFRNTSRAIDASGEGVILMEAALTAKDVKLWSVDEPTLYRVQIVVGRDTLVRSFGIRKFEAKGTKLLLNGEPVSYGGANRPLDHPVYGSTDPKEVLEKDLTLMKNAGMEFSRISHYPVSTQLLDWADEHGMLIIAEAGNWQLTQAQMNDPKMRARFQSQFREMVERDWNHPSVVAWSVGNEYPSTTDEGKSWTKDMYAYSKQLDPTRLVTFASMFVWRDNVKKAEDEASQYVDFISANIYGNHLHNIENIHRAYPDKPIYISEFGIRTDGVKDEQEREAHLRKAMEDFRKCDYVAGACVWTFNDYRSRYPGSNANGYRPWGLVSPERELRGMYMMWVEEFTPATLQAEVVNGQLKVSVTVRNDFPSYTLKNYQVKAGEKTQNIGVLKPGESSVHTFDAAGVHEVSLIKPGGFTMVTKQVK